MNSRVKVLAVNGALAIGLLWAGQSAEARQNIQPYGQAVQPGGQVEAYGGTVILVDHNDVSLVWQPSNDPRVTDYEILYGTSPDFGKSKKVDAGVTSFFFDNLPQGNTWYFAVRSLGKSGKQKLVSDTTNLVSKFIPKIKGSH